MAKQMKCKLGENWCWVMEKSLADIANSHTKGLTSIVVTSGSTGTDRLIGIAYKKSASDNGIMLNKCPWCGEKIIADDVR